MINVLMEKLRSILNYEISPLEQLSFDERRKRINDFCANLSFQNYLNLFNQINDVILDDEIDCKEKENLIKLLIECINMYSKFYENIDLFPKEIKKVYFCFNALKRIKVGIENFLQKDIVAVKDFENILLYYMDFVDNPNNAMFINICYSEIEKINSKIINELQNIDVVGRTKESLINQDLINQFKERITTLKKE